MKRILVASMIATLGTQLYAENHAEHAAHTQTVADSVIAQQRAKLA